MHMTLRSTCLARCHHKRHRSETIKTIPSLFKNSFPQSTSAPAHVWFYQTMKTICKIVQQEPVLGFYTFLEEKNIDRCSGGRTYDRREANECLLRKKNKERSCRKIIQVQTLKAENTYTDTQ